MVWQERGWIALMHLASDRDSLLFILSSKFLMYFQVLIGGDKLAAGPLVAKVYDASLIRVTDLGNAVVGQQCQFKGGYFSCITDCHLISTSSSAHIRPLLGNNLSNITQL